MNKEGQGILSQPTPYLIQLFESQISHWHPIVGYKWLFSTVAQKDFVISSIFYLFM